MILLLKKLGMPFLAAALFLSGCGYTREATLPEGVKTIHVQTVRNKIPIGEIYAYHPGLEMLITNAVVKRLNRDGNLKVVPPEEADVILETDLLSFDQGGLRFTSLESVEEYRLYIAVRLRLRDAKTKQVYWEEPNLSGDAEYFVSDVRSLARDEAAQRAVERLARNIVDRIVEDW